MKELIEYTGGLLILIMVLTALACVWIGGVLLYKIIVSEIIVFALIMIIYKSHYSE